MDSNIRQYTLITRYGPRIRNGCGTYCYLPCNNASEQSHRKVHGIVKGCNCKGYLVIPGLTGV